MSHSPFFQILVKLKHRLLSLFTTIGTWLRRYGKFLLILPVVWNCFSIILQNIDNPAKMDWMQISGAVILIIGIWLSKDISKKLDRTLTRLFNRGVLLTNAEGFASLKDKLASQAEVWVHRGGLFCAISILIAFWVVFRFRQIQFTLMVALGAYVAGQYLSQMAFYGTLAKILRRESISICVKPGHIDGASGLKPLGDFYFFQAMVASLPALHIASWLIILPILPSYARWREPYLWLLIVAISFELLSFVLPLWLFHLEMEVQKIRLLKDADGLSQNIANIQDQLVLVQTTQEKEHLNEQLSYLTKRYWDIENMITYPIDTKTLRRFSVSNLALFTPLISKVAGNSEVFQNLEKLAKALFSGQ